MTNNEISRKLALAIGWNADVVLRTGAAIYCRQSTHISYWWWQRFDYRDPLVIWPIAERYNSFPFKPASSETTNWFCHDKNGRLVKADSAAKAVALAVIWNLL